MKANLRSLSFLAAAFSLLLCASAGAELIYGTTGTVIARFDSATPGTIIGSSLISGLQSGETVVGIDLRPANGLLYGIGSSNRLYTINPFTGVATQVGTSGTFTLSGTAFGVDFNPVPDRLRVVSNTQQNLRLNPNDGTLTTDGNLNPAGNVVGIAYSNNFAGATSTTLYEIDATTGTLGIITVPNGGGPITTVGSLGLGTNLNSNVGFDISGVGGVAYASIISGGFSRLYTINLATGAATLVGQIGAAGDGGSLLFTDITAATAVPEPSSIMLLIVGGAAALFVGYRRHGRVRA